MIFNLKTGDSVTGKYMIKKRFIFHSETKEEGSIPPNKNVEVKKHESLYIWIHKNDNVNKDIPSYLKIELMKPIKKIKIIHKNERWRLVGIESKNETTSGNNENVGNGEPDVNVEIGGV